MSIFDKDWFERKDNYIIKDESSSIGWDSSFTSEFSKYLYDSNICQSLCDHPQRLVPEFREMMNSVNLKKDIECYINTKADESFTDGKKIFVSNACAKDNSLSCFDKIDIMLGLLLHESAHCLYTDFSQVIQDINDPLSEPKKHIQNIFEDEAIEEKMSIRWPGNSNYLGALKKYYFSKSIDDIAENTPVNFIDEIFSLILLVIRYPNKVKDYVEKSSKKEKIEDIFSKIYNIVSSSGYFKMSSNYDVTVKTKKIAEDIIELLKEYFDEDDINKQFQQAEGDNESSISIYEKSSKKVQSSSEFSSKLLAKAIEDKFDKLVSKENKKINRDITESMKTLKNGSFWTSSDQSKYNAILNETRKYSMSLKRQILKTVPEDKLVVLNNMRTGILNTSKLIEAYQGIEQIYDKKIIKRNKNNLTPKYALVIIMDESGSMQSLKELVIKTTIMIYEVFAGEKEIELFVYGHGDKVNTYIDKTKKNKFVLSDIDSQMDQNEAESYSKILNSVHSQTKLNAVVISLTDSYYCYDREEFTKTLDYYKEKFHDSFNLVKLTTYDLGDEEDENPEVIEENNELYGEDGWFEVADNKDALLNISKKLMDILKTNYRKSEKLHR